MTMPNSSPNTGSPTRPPFGIIVAESYFVTFVAVISFRLIADLDFYTRSASRLNLHFFQFFVGPGKALGLIVGVLSIFAVIGLQRMRPWGRRLAITLAGVSVVFVVWFYSAVLVFRIWTSVPNRAWPHAVYAVYLCLGIYIVWYLLQSRARRAFRSLQRDLLSTPRGKVMKTTNSSWLDMLAQSPLRSPVVEIENYARSDVAPDFCNAAFARAAVGSSRTESP
jgi:hypothetical protein